MTISNRSLVEPGDHVLVSVDLFDPPTAWIAGRVVWLGDGRFVVDRRDWSSRAAAACDLFSFCALRSVAGIPHILDGVHP